MVYCVIPPELEAELFARMQAYYAQDENVTVLVDRRKEERRKGDEPAPDVAQRELRDRRRRGVPGDFPPVPSEHP